MIMITMRMMMMVMMMMMTMVIISITITITIIIIIIIIHHTCGSKLGMEGRRDKIIAGWRKGRTEKTDGRTDGLTDRRKRKQREGCSERGKDGGREEKGAVRPSGE